MWVRSKKAGMRSHATWASTCVGCWAWTGIAGSQGWHKAPDVPGPAHLVLHHAHAGLGYRHLGQRQAGGVGSLSGGQKDLVHLQGTGTSAR